MGVKGHYGERCVFLSTGESAGGAFLVESYQIFWHVLKGFFFFCESR
jgi:hypothetical protein